MSSDAGNLKRRSREMKHDSRNLKYGGTAAAVSVILIAAIILINVIFTALSAK